MNTGYPATGRSQFRQRFTHKRSRPGLPEPDPDPKFSELCRLEPRLADLLAEAQAAGSGGRGNGFSRIWTYEIKPKLRQIIGWNREDKGGDECLRSSESFEIVTRALVTAIETGTTYPVQGSEKR